MTSLEYRVAILQLVTALFPSMEQGQWMLIPQPSLNGDSPAQAIEKGHEEEVYQLLLRTKKGN
jgi:hypothetical protein